MLFKLAPNTILALAASSLRSSMAVWVIVATCGFDHRPVTSSSAFSSNRIHLFVRFFIFIYFSFKLLEGSNVLNIVCIETIFTWLFLSSNHICPTRCGSACSARQTKAEFRTSIRDTAFFKFSFDMCYLKSLCFSVSDCLKPTRTKSLQL